MVLASTVSTITRAFVKPGKLEYSSIDSDRIINQLTKYASALNYYLTFLIIRFFFLIWSTVTPVAIAKRESTNATRLRARTALLASTT